MKPETTIFYDIDTQRDFLESGGSLYSPLADLIRPRLAEITALAREYSIRIVASMDRHPRDEKSVPRSAAPIAAHCIDATAGQNKIPETAPLKPLRLGHNEMRPKDIEEAIEHDGEIIFDRPQFERLADSPHARAVIRLALQPYDEIVIYGVYCSRCVDRAVLGLVGLGPKLTMVRDATLVIPGDDSIFNRLSGAGIELITLEELKARAISP